MASPLLRKPHRTMPAGALGVIGHLASMLKTERLLLRQWTEKDFDPFYDMCSDNEVMEFFPKALSKHEGFELGRKIQSLIAERGWGFWAVEIPGQHPYIGFVGLHIPNENLPCSPCVEIGWRLSREHWNKGYASEGAKAALRYAFSELKLNEVVSFTTTANVRSRSVMQKIGMRNTAQNFMHPDIDVSNPQCEHVLYKINKGQWSENAL